MPDIINPEELAESNIDHDVTLVELEAFIEESSIYKWLMAVYDTHIEEVRNNLEDPDSPPEDMMFQRGRVREVRLLKNEFITLLAEVKMAHEMAAVAQQLEEEEKEDVSGI